MSKYDGRLSDVAWIIGVLYTGSWLARMVAKYGPKA